jgi:hypothetical protein
MSTLLELAERCETGAGSDNGLDVLVEVALFKPDEWFVSVRSNHAGTKVIYTGASGSDHTHWPPNWTADRARAANALRARAAVSPTIPGEVK